MYLRSLKPDLDEGNQFLQQTTAAYKPLTHPQTIYSQTGKV